MHYTETGTPAGEPTPALVGTRTVDADAEREVNVDITALDGTGTPSTLAARFGLSPDGYGNLLLGRYTPARVDALPRGTACLSPQVMVKFSMDPAAPAGLKWGIHVFDCAERNVLRLHINSDQFVYFATGYAAARCLVASTPRSAAFEA